MIALKALLETFDDLFNFYPIGHMSFMVDTSTQVPCACEMSVTPRNNCEREFVATVHEVSLLNVSLNYRHDPFLALDTLVEVPRQEVVEHGLVVPRFECF